MSGAGLVLGGGGPIGVAWYSGLVRGLADRGVELSEADTVVGTSAGAIAGVWIAAGADIGAFMRTVQDDARQRKEADLSAALDLEVTAEVYARLGRARAPLERDEARELCEIGARATTDQDAGEYLAHISRLLPDVDWPPALHVAVVRATTGELWIVGEGDDVALASAVTASAAAPGARPPIPVGGELCVDGGARSSTNADALAAADVDRVLLVNPVASDTPLVGAGVQRTVAEEIRRLEHAGKAVRRLDHGDIEQRAFGLNLLDLSRAAAAIEAGIQRGRREAQALASWWATG